MLLLKKEEVYFEHFGMMSDCDYCEKAILKMQEYEKHGLYLGKNLTVKRLLVKSEKR